jgi:RNA polymerase sigma factor (sigma-70 family)
MPLALVQSNPEPVGSADIEQLFTALAPRLERIVRGGAGVAEPVVEDACQFAWSRLVDLAHSVRRDGALSWLATTAVHEAYRLERRSRAEEPMPDDEDTVVRGSAPSAHEVVELRERIASVGRLPERQRQVLWLRAAGYSYAEIGASTGDTRRTVERQLARATRRVRELDAAA